MNSAELLTVSERLLTEPAESLVGLWPRTAALLARQAIEQSLAVVWQMRAPPLEACSFHAQFLVLPSYLRNADVARGAAYAWMVLTHACHYHAYELSPTVSELRVQIEAAKRFDHAVGALTSNSTV